MTNPSPCRSALFIDALYKRSDLHETELLRDSCPILMAQVDGRRSRHFLRQIRAKRVRTKRQFRKWLQSDYDFIYIAAHGVEDREKSHAAGIGGRGWTLWPDEISKLDVKARYLLVNACFGYNKELRKAFRRATRRRKASTWYAGSRILLNHDEAYVLGFLVLHQIITNGRSLRGGMTAAFTYPGVTGSYMAATLDHS